MPSSACDLMGILLEDHVLLELITLCGVENRDIHDPPTDNECSIPHQILQYRFIRGSTQWFEDSFGGQNNAQHCFTQRWCDERQRAMANGELSGFFLSDLIDDRTQQRPAHFTEHRVCWTTAQTISPPLSLHSVLSHHFPSHGSDQKWFSYTKTLMQSVQTQRRTFHKRFRLVPKPSILPT